MEEGKGRGIEERNLPKGSRAAFPGERRQWRGNGAAAAGVLNAGRGKERVVVGTGKTGHGASFLARPERG